MVPAALLKIHFKIYDHIALKICIFQLSYHACCVNIKIKIKRLRINASLHRHKKLSEFAQIKRLLKHERKILGPGEVN